MKKILTLLAFASFTMYVQSQVIYPSGISITNNGNMSDWTNGIRLVSYNSYADWVIKNDPNYHNLYISPNRDISGGLIVNPYALSVGNSVTSGKTSLKCYISGSSDGYSAIQAIKSYPSTFGILALNPSGGSVNIGSTVDYGIYGGVLNVYKNQNPNIRLNSGSNGHLEFGVASNNGAFISFAKPGDAIMRKLGGTGSLILAIPNDNSDGSCYIKFGNANGEIFGIYSNKKAILNGNLLIGKTTQADPTNKIDVNGKIRADEIIVNTEGADIVFENNYQLRSLSEVEKFIKANKHLPDITPAVQMQAKGVGISELQTKLLMKIEELTLYTIEQNKKLQAQEIKNTLLEQKMKEQDVKYMQLLKMVEELKK